MSWVSEQAADGTILTSVSDDDMASLIAVLRQQGAEAIAVAFVNSYLNPANESAVVSTLRRALGIKAVTQSSSLIPERGEFERTSTAVLNAYLTPVMTTYLDTLVVGALAVRHTCTRQHHGLQRRRHDVRRGGRALRRDVPVGACWRRRWRRLSVAGMARRRATSSPSTWVAPAPTSQLVHALTPRMSHDNQIDAYPLRMPQLDIHTIGAGGGSIIWAGPDGTMKIGPQSAGAVPGPACYGRGGSRRRSRTPICCSVACRPSGRWRRAEAVDALAAERAFRALGAALGSDDPVALADGRRFASRSRRWQARSARSRCIAASIRASSCCVGFGGAGPMQVFLVAKELGMRHVLIPRIPGHLSALGQMMADLRRDFVKAWGGRLSEISPEALTTEVEMLRRQGTELLLADGIDRGRHRHEVAVDMRYVGQSFTLSVAWRLEDQDFQPLRLAFDRRHEETFGYADTINDAEIVNVRLVSIGAIDKPQVRFTSPAEVKLSLGRRRAWFGGWIDTAIYDRAEMPTGLTIEGPAIVEEAGGTTIVPPRWTVRVHDSGALLCSSDDPKVR